MIHTEDCALVREGGWCTCGAAFREAQTARELRAWMRRERSPFELLVDTVDALRADVDGEWRRP